MLNISVFIIKILEIDYYVP